MHYTKSLGEFASRNQDELKRLVTSVCIRQKVPPVHVDDILQDVYLRMIGSEVLERFDPQFGGFSTKISTYLYPVISNIVSGFKKKNNFRMETRKFRASEAYKEETGMVDDVEIALRCCNVTPEFQAVLDHNDASDETHGLAADLNEFENKWLGKTYRNRRFSLKHRRDKSVGHQGCSLLDVYRHINNGLTNKQIAEIYGVSGAFITHLKHIIVRSLRAYGISNQPGFKPECWNDVEIPVKVPKVSVVKVVPLVTALERPVGKNGHRHEFQRPMNQQEREQLRTWWLARSGIVGWDDVREFRKSHFPEEVSIMQVCGFVSSLHKALARGDLNIADRAGYNANRASRGQSTIPLDGPKSVTVPCFTLNDVVFSKRRVPKH